MAPHSTLDSSAAADAEINHEVRKRRGSFPIANKAEVLLAEMLAPLPQGNISRVPSYAELLVDDEESETKPLLKVNKINYL